MTTIFQALGQIPLSTLLEYPEVVQKNEIKGRVDLRDLPLVTIDSEDARDFDDAVYCKKEGDKFRLYVAIADVSYYVRTGSAIDAEALERTTSVYFPFYVIPMLPKELSNGICSLNQTLTVCVWFAKWWLIRTVRLVITSSIQR